MLLFRVIKERETGLEPAASTLARSRSTNWATRACFCMLPCIEGIKLIIYSSLRYFREAGDGNRTHVSSLEGWCSTIELHPHIFCPVWITRTNDIITENLFRVKTHYQFSVIMPRTGIEPVTRGFSVLCSTDWAIWANQFACANSDKIISRTIVQVYLLRLGLKSAQNQSYFILFSPFCQHFCTLNFHSLLRIYMALNSNKLWSFI